MATVLRPRPIEPIEGKRVAFFTTADASATELLEGTSATSTAPPT